MRQPWYVDRDQPDTGIWSAPTRSPIFRHVFNRGATENIKLRFCADGSTTQLGSGSTVTLVFKETRQDTSLLIASVEATQSGADYILSPVFLGSTLDTALDGADSIAVVGELSWEDSSDSFGDGSIQFDARINQNLATGGETVPVTPEAFVALTPSEDDSREISAANGVAVVSCIAEAGAGSYTYKIVLITTGVPAGALADVYIEVPASINPTIEVREGDEDGEIRHVTNGDPGKITTESIRFRFNGTNWQKWGPGELA